MPKKSSKPNQRFFQVSLFFTSGLLRNAIGLGLGLLATPVLVRLLGEESYGAWLTLADWIGHLGLLEFGLASAILPIFAKSLLKQEGLSPRKVAREAIYKYGRVLFFQLLAAFILSFFILKLIPVGQNLQQDLIVAFVCMSLSTVFSLSNVFRAFLLASHQGYWVSLVMIAQNILAIAGALVAAYFHTGITGQAVAHTLALGISFGLMVVISNLGVKNLFRGKRRAVEFDDVLKTQRMPHFIAQVCGRATFLIDRLIIAAFLGPAVVTSFYLTQRLINLAAQQIQQVGNSTWSAMSELYLKGKLDDFNSRLVIITEFIACFSSCGLCVLILFNESFVGLWVGEKHFLSQDITNLFILNSGLLGINTFWHWCFTGTGLINKLLPMLVAQGVLSVSASLLGTQYLGVYGPPLGTFIALFILTQPWTALLLQRNFQSSFYKLSKAWILPFLVPITMCMGVVKHFGAPHIQKWELLVLAMGTNLALNFLIFPYVFLSRESRNYLYGKLKAVAKEKLGNSKT